MNNRLAVATDCYHCGLPVPPGSHYPVVIDGAAQAMCCPGCQAVASAIVDGGLDRFYQYRSQLSSTPSEKNREAEVFASYDLPEVQRDFVRQEADGASSTELQITGITCSACAWLIEHHLAKVPGLISLTVNVSTHRARVKWHPGLAVSEILAAFDEIGYEARPAGDVEAEKKRDREAKLFLLRLGVAGLGMMQAGHAAIALYFGAYTDIEPVWELLLRWVSLVITTPIVFFSSQPFFVAAWRSLKTRHLVMDVPVALAIALAYLASVWATFTMSGEVYFDSVSMFAFLLLLGRYLEMRVRHRNEYYSATLSQLIPPVATRLDTFGEQVVAVKSLVVGDCIRVASGATIPCDGVVVEGRSAVIEAVLTGEQNPVVKEPGSGVSAGTINGDSALQIRVSHVGQNTRLGTILDLVASAQSDKPRMATQADRVASWFVAAVLLVSAGVAGIWWFIDSSRALWVTLSVLVVTCPCALSLATPTALTVASGELRRRGFLICRGHVLETLAVVDRCVFDKTGTLTLGDMTVRAVIPLADYSARQLLAVAAGLEKGSSHPIAGAFANVHGARRAVDQQMRVGEGVAGTVDGVPFAFGKPGFAAGRFGHAVPELPADGLALLLANDHQVVGWIVLDDTLRPGAEQAIAALVAAGVAVELLSGDRPEAAAAIAERVGMNHWEGGATPERKLARIRELQAEGHRVLMVGDGINDVPVLGGADVSVAMAEAADVTRLHADSLLVSGNLETLPAAVRLARRTRAIIRQNHGWALGYNLVALPLATAGMIPPWLAAIGMSLSSLLVVLNALRLGRRQPSMGMGG